MVDDQTIIRMAADKTTTEPSDWEFVDLESSVPTERWLRNEADEINARVTIIGDRIQIDVMSQDVEDDFDYEDDVELEGGYAF